MSFPRAVVSTAAVLSVLTSLTLGLSGCGPAKETASAATPAAASVASAPAVDLTNGKNVFTRVCSVCHQLNGAGVPGVFPPLAGCEIVDGDPHRLIRIVLAGLQGPIEVSGKTYNSVMPPQAAMLKDQEIADVLSYVRSSWGHSAAPVAVADVATLRAENRTTFWTWTELNAASAK